MTTKSPRAATRLAKGMESAHLLLLAALALLLVVNHARIIFAPVPLDYYEGTMPLITGVIAAGHNPYTLAFQPVHADVYPPLYNLVVAPLTLLFGNTLALHRAVSACFIVASCALLALASRRAGARRADATAAALLLYAALLFYSTPIASTNATGTFLFLASVLLPWLGRFGWPALLASIACGVLAFYAKQYFLVGIAIVAAYLFLSVAKTRALAYAALAGLTLAASLVAVHVTSPFFLDNTVFSVANAVNTIRSTAMMWRQLGVFATLYPGLLLLAALAGAGALAGLPRRPRQSAARRLVLRPLAAPLLGVQLSYPWFCFACATAVIVTSLGHNPGNYMTYLLQLMTPFLLLGVFGLAWLRGARRALLLPLAWISFAQAYLLLPRDFSVDMTRWARVEELVAQSDEILASQIVLNVLLEQDKRVYQDGHTFYFPFAARKPAMFEPRDPQLRVDAVWNRYLGDLYQRVGERRFDLVILNDWDLQGIFGQNPPPGQASGGVEYFQRFYERAESIPLSMTQRHGGGTFVMHVWRPRADVAAPKPG